ncbi:MAG TPA: hypothetical protein VKY56_07240 [Chloroflexota bacterium]|nr:hypothetical protein [Chloroflexota bacterium]
MIKKVPAGQRQKIRPVSSCSADLSYRRSPADKYNGKREISVADLAPRVTPHQRQS